ncbi:MAG: sigma-70 family RNA polymerase sigma factor [Myxococcales bacterium]|nr:sigma-70 family RNA polymerase sigma factor [Myxococcales bacterium]
MRPLGPAMTEPEPRESDESAMGERASSRPGASAASPEAQTRLAEVLSDGFDSVWRLLRRLGVPADAAEDAAQEVFVVATRRIAQITPGSEKSFLFGTALRVAHGFRRRRQRELARDLEIQDNHAVEHRTPEQILDQRQRIELLDQLLESLPDEERSVFVLFELEGLTLAEIAELSGAPRGTVASRLRRGRSRYIHALRAHTARNAPPRLP